MGAVSKYIKIPEEAHDWAIRLKWQTECNALFICPECERVYQTLGWDGIKPKREEYLTDFPKLQHKRICKECK